MARSILTSDEALKMNRVPASAIVLGAGAVGVEFASLYRSCGAEVTIVEMLPSLVPLEDAAVGGELRKPVRGPRHHVPHRATCSTSGSIERNEGGVAVTVAGEDGKEQRLQAEMLLVAVGTGGQRREHRHRGDRGRRRARRHPGGRDAPDR